MAKKKETDNKATDFHPFIKDVILKSITSNIDWITEACRKYEGLEEIPKSIWDKLNGLLIDISLKGRDYPYESYYFIDTPYRMASYNITHRVREKQRKEFILKWADKLDPKDDEWNVYVCNQIFLHIAVWLNENAVQQLQKPAEETKKSEKILE